MVLIPALLVFAGCVSSNPKAAFNDLDQMVKTRTGRSVQWRNGETNEFAQLIASLLATNLTEQSAVMIALLNNRSLQAAFEEVGISQADVAQSSRLQNPELYGSWRIPNRPPSAVDIEYSAVANLLDLLTLRARKKIARRNLEEVKLVVADQVLRLGAEVQTTFYTLEAQMELVHRFTGIVQANEAAADLAQRQYDAGNINDLQLHNQEAPAVQSRFDLSHAEAQTKVVRERLNRLLGLSSEQLNWRIAGELPTLPTGELPLENLESAAVRQRLDLAAARERAEALADALRLKKRTRFIPGVAVGVDTERTPDGQRVTGPTLALELPLFDQGQPAVAKLAAQLRQARDDYEALEVNIRSEVREARDALLAARQAAKFAQTNLLPLQRRILRETLLQYNAMQKNTFDLLLAKEREQNSEQRTIEALRDYWIAHAELERVAGGRLSAGSYPAKPDTHPLPHEQPH